MDKRTKQWVKVMTITRKIWGCHQKPERSFFVCGYQFPLCARCTGVLLGYLIALLLLFCSCKISVLLCLIFLVPLVLDGGIQLAFNLLSNNARRLVTGVLFGIGFIHLIANLILYLIQLLCFTNEAQTLNGLCFILFFLQCFVQCLYI